MKKTLIPILMILISVFTLAIIPTEAEAAIYEDTLRLHILAPSNSAEDQALKFQIRDKILEKYSSALSGAKSAEEAETIASKMLKNIENDCNDWIKSFGFSYTAEVILNYEWYDTRHYGNFSLPCGYYSSLKVVIGEGEGENWWCVMYPPLCLDMAKGKYEGYSDAENGIISKSGYRIKFKVLELISSTMR